MFYVLRKNSKNVTLRRFNATKRRAARRFNAVKS
jgi:hypothetical protein